MVRRTNRASQPCWVGHNMGMGILADHRLRRRRYRAITASARSVRGEPLPPGVTPVLITVRDRLDPLEELVKVLESVPNCEPILVDNASSYPPLMRYLKSTRHRVYNLGSNLGARAAWISGLVAEFGSDRHYVVTDPDVVPDADCPDDFLIRFASLLEKYPDVGRVGFGLRIDDLPSDQERSAQVITWESQFWDTEREAGVYEADIDTTFALYRSATPVRGSVALRTGFPYVARHLAWYEDPDNPNDEERYYQAHADQTINSWNNSDLPPHLEKLIGDRHTDS